MIELAIVLGAIGALVGLGWAVQRSFVYFPGTTLPGPAARGLPGAEEVSLRTEDGLSLGAWFLPSRGARGTVLVCNGNAGDRSHRAPLATALARAGFSVLLFDYRGYGGNAGSPTEPGLLADARAAVRHLALRPDVDPDRIVYFGESLGAGVATALALERTPQALVLRSPFTSLADMGRHHYPLLPVWLVLLDRYPVVEQVARLDAPVLVVAAAQDMIVPYEQSRRVYEAARGPKDLVTVRGADHNDQVLAAGERLVSAITAFVAANSR